MYQSKKWILDRRYHTPMVSEHGIDFFVKEFVWAKYECKKIIGYLSSIFTEASPTDSTYPETYAELIICRLHDEKLCFTTNTVKVTTSDLISQYDGPMNTDLVGWKITKDSTIVKLSHDKSKSLCEGNILRKNAKGKKVVSVPVVLFSDDVGGSSTHKWNAFSVWCLMLGGLPKKENNDLQNILFLNASNSVSALELSKPLVAELKVLENLGVTMYDASLGEEVMVVSPVFLVKADNKRQSDVVSHLGSCAVKFCQKCTISRVDDDVTTVGDVRSKQFVQEAIGKIKDAESESAKKTIRAQYGVTEIENPLMKLESFDNARSIAYERLHSIELGLVKVVTQLTFCNMSQHGKDTAAAKLEAFDWSAFGRRLSPSFIEKHKSFLGRDFKVFAQVAPFILAESIPREQLIIWHLISKVFNIVHSGKFSLSDAEKLESNCQFSFDQTEANLPGTNEKTKDTHVITSYRGSEYVWTV
ncbi:uncharacterized protein [Ptychodera flava]|uniref:uncharacterized protein isoform X1 n=1 Tax=Ptychodera flava TaxID=63121 RepID=UPI00396A9268